jgi:hypothetical protein
MKNKKLQEMMLKMQQLYVILDKGTMTLDYFGGTTLEKNI